MVMNRGRRLALIFFKIAGKHYLAAVDYYSNFIEIDLMTTMTSARTVTSLKKHYARYGIPRMIVSDGGPQFTSQEFKLFVDNWGITHITSSPMHQRANGRAEAAVKTEFMRGPGRCDTSHLSDFNET